MRAGPQAVTMQSAAIRAPSYAPSLSPIARRLQRMQLDGIAAKAATVLQAHSQILLICLISLQLSHHNQSRTRHGSATVTPSPATTESGRG
jgi:hypothetical protein